MGNSKSEPRRCGARTRSGGTCRAPIARKGRGGRCWRHGGAVKAQGKSARRKRSAEDICARKDEAPVDRAIRPDRSLYAEAVLPDETHLYCALPVGQVDDELRLCRLRLSRAAAAEARLIARGETDGLIRIQDEINRITTSIDRLESRRAQLAKAAAESAGIGAAGAGDDPKILDQTIGAVLDDIESLTAPVAEAPDGDADP